MNSKIRAQINELNSTISKINELYSKWAKQNGLNYNTLMVLYALDSGEHSQKQICDKWLIPKQTVNTILLSFKKKGYVVFKLSDSDKREKIIGFTERGKQYADSILAALYLIEENTMIKMGEEVSGQLIESNRKYCECFKKEVGDV